MGASNLGALAASAGGKRIGRPTVAVDAVDVARLRAQGASWREIAQKLGVGATTARRAFSKLAKSPGEIPSSSKTL